jgi:hypothetical protein
MEDATMKSELQDKIISGLQLAVIPTIAIAWLSMAVMAQPPRVSAEARAAELARLDNDPAELAARAEMTAACNRIRRENIKLGRRVYGDGNPDHLEVLGSQFREEHQIPFSRP